jgi:(S)-ureidoglycine-glyoxylate aminotransferase
MVDPRVLRAMGTPLLGQFDPEFTAIMNEVMALSRFAFQTQNACSFPVSGTGRAGLEAAIGSIVEPGERVVVAECGRFGLLLIEIAERCGAEVVAVRGEWGRVVEPAAVEAALKSGKTKLVATIHGETSTGVLQPLEELARLAHTHGALLMTDAVVTLGGCEVAVDAWGVDVAVAGSSTTGVRRASTITRRRRPWCTGCARRCARSRSRACPRASPAIACTAMLCALASRRWASSSSGWRLRSTGSPSSRR